MARKRQSKTAKRISNLLRQVRRMEKRFYVFPESIREEIKNLSPQKAVHYTTETLYKKALGLGEYGELIPGTEARKLERSHSAQKGVQTKKLKKYYEEEYGEPWGGYVEEPEQPSFDEYQHYEEPYEVQEDILSNFTSLLDFLYSEPSKTIITNSGKEVPKPSKLYVYEVSQRKYLQHIFEAEKAKDANALARRLYDNYTEIDDLMGVIDYQGYDGAVQVAGNKLANIIKGNGTSPASERMAVAGSMEDNMPML